jgi:hypothetical protein
MKINSHYVGKLGQLSMALLAVVGACKSKAKPATVEATGSAAVVAPGSSALPVAPPLPPPVAGVLNLESLPPLGAPDAIEPPSRDIVPGMSIAAAKAKGCKDVDVSYRLDWKKDIDVGIDKAAGVVTQLDVTYTKAAFEALKLKWGKPGFDADWLGANWLASLNGCDVTCTVTFTRSPLVLLGASPMPPLGLATLQQGSTIGAMTALLGVESKDRSGVGTGFSLSIGLDADNDAVGTIVIDDASNRKIESWIPLLEKQWGPGLKLDGAGSIDARARWTSKDKRWVVELGNFGDTLRYTPIEPSQQVFANLRALPAKLWNKPKTMVQALPGMKEDAFEFSRTELSFDSSSYYASRLTVDYDDKDNVDEINIIIASSEVQMKATVAAWQSVVGAPKKTKNADGEQQQVVIIDGITFVVEFSDTSIDLHAMRPEPAQP